MHTKKNVIGMLAGCTLIAASVPVASWAGKVPSQSDMLTDVSSVYVNLEGAASQDCMGHFQFEPQDSGIGMASEQAKADAILNVSLTPPVTKEGLGLEVAYTAALVDPKGKTLYTDSGDEFAGTASEACKDIADHLASDIADAREDAVDEIE